MDPLTPTTSTLSPAIAYIAETAAALAVSLKERTKVSVEIEDDDESAETEHRDVQRDTVKWVLDSPRRLGEMVEKGDRGEAERDWETVRALLDKWKGVKGVEQVREDCLKALDSDRNRADES